MGCINKNSSYWWFIAFLTSQWYNTHTPYVEGVGGHGLVRTNWLVSDPAATAWGLSCEKDLYTLWLFNIAMENGPFIDGLPLKNGDFPWLC